MKSELKITSPRARLEISYLSLPDFYLQYYEATYRSEWTNGRWWHRTLAGDMYHWLQLSGRNGTHPKDALQLILSQRRRTAIPLPPLLVAHFLAYAPDPDAAEARSFFRWAALGTGALLELIPAQPSAVGWLTVPPEMLDDLVTAALDAIVQGSRTIPWSTTDGDSLQLLVQMVERLWTFPPALVQQIVARSNDVHDALAILAQQEDDSASWGDEDLVLTTPSSLLGQMSALHCWQVSTPTVRNIPVCAPAIFFPAAWHQALVLTHPDAPSIDDEDLKWLCNGVLGAPDEEPLAEFYAYATAFNAASSTEYRTRIINLHEEVVQATQVSTGRYEFLLSTQIPMLTALGVDAVRLVVTPLGYWIRLLPQSGGWGSVIWWKPQIEPPVCLAFASETERTNSAVFALHEILWRIWRNIQLDKSSKG